MQKPIPSPLGQGGIGQPPGRYRRQRAASTYGAEAPGNYQYSS